MVSGKADQDRLAAVFLARKLADIQLGALTHIRRAFVAEMGIMLPDGNFGAAGLPIETSSVSAMWRSRTFHDDTSSRNTER